MTDISVRVSILCNFILYTFCISELECILFPVFI